MGGVGSVEHVGTFLVGDGGSSAVVHIRGHVAESALAIFVAVLAKKV